VRRIIEGGSSNFIASTFRKYLKRRYFLAKNTLASKGEVPIEAEPETEGPTAPQISTNPYTKMYPKQPKLEPQ
jgi:hypothetical protein